MLADLQADGIQPCTNDRVKRAERGCARPAEQVSRTCELMQSGPAAESESRVEKAFSTFSGEKDTEFRRCDCVEWILRASGWGDKIWQQIQN